MTIYWKPMLQHLFKHMGKGWKETPLYADGVWEGNYLVCKGSCDHVLVRVDTKPPRGVCQGCKRVVPESHLSIAENYECCVDCSH